MALAGGASRRLAGSPKGLEIVGGRRILDAVVAALRSVSSDIVLAANDPAAEGWLPGVQVVRDRRPGTGGLAGVDAALAACNGDAMVVAWDMPFVTPALLRAILTAARAHDADAVLPDSDSPYGFEPFCAFYSARIRPALAAFLERGGGAARDFVRDLPRAHHIPLAEVSLIGDPQRLFLSVNTPADLERARALAG